MFYKTNSHSWSDDEMNLDSVESHSCILLIEAAQFDGFVRRLLQQLIGK